MTLAVTHSTVATLPDEPGAEVNAAEWNANHALAGRADADQIPQGSALSVLGVAGNATADQASIAAATDKQVMRRSGTTIGWGAIDLASSDAVSGVLPLANGGSTGTNTGDQTSIVGISGTIAQFNTALSDGDFATGGGTATGSNTGDNATNTQYSGLAASKQDTLVSGTNIKTINGSSVLGSGDLVVSGSGTRTIGMTFDGGGSPPMVGAVGYVVAQFSGTIDQWSIIADASGSAVVDVWKAAGAIPTVANTIAGSEKPTLSATQLNSDTSLSSWTTAVTVGDVFGFNIDSVTTCTRLTVEVRVQAS